MYIIKMPGSYKVFSKELIKWREKRSKCYYLKKKLYYTGKQIEQCEIFLRLIWKEVIKLAVSLLEKLN